MKTLAMKPAKRNPVAWDLRSPKYRMRTEVNRKREQRNHPPKELQL